MNWNILNDVKQLELIDQESLNKLVLILKHSTRCSISITALGRFERSWKESDSNFIKPYYLDLLNFRDISNLIANRYHIEHQSPQILLINKGICIFSQTHLDISYSDIINLKL